MKATCKNSANLEQETKTTKVVTYPLLLLASSVGHLGVDSFQNIILFNSTSHNLFIDIKFGGFLENSGCASFFRMTPAKIGVALKEHSHSKTVKKV